MPNHVGNYNVVEALRKFVFRKLYHVVILEEIDNNQMIPFGCHTHRLSRNTRYKNIGFYLH